MRIAISHDSTWLVLSISAILCGLLMGQSAQGKERAIESLSKNLEPTKKIAYKTIDKQQLFLHVFNPEGLHASDKRACLVVIPGGGWTTRYHQECYVLAKRLSDRGMVGICIDYRVINKKRGIKVVDCVKDGRSAMRYVRAHAKELGIDPEKIVAGGFSAGGHIAVGTALFEDINDETDGKQLSATPNALVLYYPVIDTSKDGYGMKKIGDQWRELSPVHQVKAGMPPTIIFHGTADTVTPYAGAVKFQKQMELHNNKCELVPTEGGVHGYLIFDLKLFELAMQRTEAFLKSNDFLLPVRRIEQ